MANVGNVYTPANIIQGPADVYLDVQNPTSAIPPVQGTNTWAATGTYSIDSNGQPTDNGQLAAPAAPTLTGTGTGGLPAGTYYVKITYTNAYGESLASAEGSVVLTAGQNIQVTAPAAAGSGTYAATGYNVYASSATGAETQQNTTPVALTTNFTTSGATLSTTGLSVPAANTSGGLHIGLSDGPVILSVAPKFLEIKADQHAAPVDAAFTSMETEVDFVVKEALLRNLQRFFSSVLGTYTNVAAGANPAADFLQVGSANTDAVTFHTLLLISPDKSNAGKFYIVNLYKAMLMSAIQTTFHRTTQSEWKLKFRGISDTTRVLGDMVAQVVKTI